MHSTLLGVFDSRRSPILVVGNTQTSSYIEERVLAAAVFPFLIFLQSSLEQLNKRVKILTWSEPPEQQGCQAKDESSQMTPA